MAAVITSVLAGASVALVVAVVADHSRVGPLLAGGAVAVVGLGSMMRYLHVTWTAHLRRIGMDAST